MIEKIKVNIDKDVDMENSSFEELYPEIDNYDFTFNFSLMYYTQDIHQMTKDKPLVLKAFIHIIKTLYSGKTKVDPIPGISKALINYVFKRFENSTLFVKLGHNSYKIGDSIISDIKSIVDV